MPKHKYDMIYDISGSLGQVLLLTSYPSFGNPFPDIKLLSSTRYEIYPITMQTLSDMHLRPKMYGLFVAVTARDEDKFCPLLRVMTLKNPRYGYPRKCS